MNLRNNIPQADDTENIPVFLEALKKEAPGFKVPTGSLIIPGIHQSEV